MACIIFTLQDGSTIHAPLGVDLLTIGRSPDSIVQLPDPSVSNQHALIKPREDGYYVQDLDSRNGTRVNEAVIEEALLQDGDRVAFGDILSVFYYADDVPATAVLEEVPELIEEAPPPPPPPLPVMPEVIEPLVHSVSATGIPRGLGSDPSRHYSDKPKRRRVYSEGSGCGTAIMLILLFGAAFFIGLYLRHHKVTDGGSLVKDIIDRVMPDVKIEIKQQGE